MNKKTASIILSAMISIGSTTSQTPTNVPEPDNTVKVDTLAETSQSWDGATLPNYPTTTPQITILRYTFPTHRRLTPHTHSIINCGVMLRGELTIVTLDGREHTFREGYVVMEMIGTVHYGENRGDQDAEVIMFYAGTEGLPLKEEAQ